MGRKKETREIAGMQVTVQQFAPMRSYDLLVLAGKTLGPVLSSVVPALSNGGIGALLASNVDVLAAALGQLDVESARTLLLRVLAGTTVVLERDGKSAQVDLSGGAKEVDLAFEDGGIPAMFAVAKFALEVNFSVFSRGVTALASAGTPAADTP